ITHQQLHHPNILPFLGIYNEDAASHPLTILPFIECGSLEDVLASLSTNGLMKPPDFIQLLFGTSRGLIYLHSRMPPIIHGDLHPGNILIGEGGNPLLCDFGRSRIRHDTSRGLSNHKDLEGGRLRFLAPEFWHSQTNHFCINQDSDMFGLSMTYLNAWTCQPPFPEIKLDREVTAVLNTGQRPLEPVVATPLSPEIRENFWKLLVDMWAHEAPKRPSSSQILERIEQMFGNCQSVSS
ncbi:kinase-like protein, partial [Clavulina sp. PMI_390]